MTRTCSQATLALLAFTAGVPAQFLVAADSNRELSTLDPSSGAKSIFATVASSAVAPTGLAYDPSTRELYLSSTTPTVNSLYRLDLATGTPTLIGPYGGGVMLIHGLEIDASTGRLYGASSFGGLYAIDRSTAATTLIGMSGLAAGSMSLGFDSRSNVMYATSATTDSLYRMDLTTGAATLVGPLNGPTTPNGLAYDSDSGTLCLVDNQTDSLYTVDTRTGAATLVGSTGSGNLLGLAYLPRSQGGFTRLAHACGPTTISTVGLPRVGHTFHVTLGGVTGAPLLGLGSRLATVPFCGCTIGHDWSLVFATGSLAIDVPSLRSLVGLRLGLQGLDYLGIGGCVSPQLTLSDTIVVTIG